jgi:hypothetical protein
VLNIQAYEARQKEYAMKGQKHFYFMSLSSSEVIDACIKGNLGRFINHSCEPNCRTEKVAKLPCPFLLLFYLQRRWPNLVQCREMSLTFILDHVSQKHSLLLVDILLL